MAPMKMITAAIIVIASTLVCADFTINTNRPELIDRTWLFQKYHEIANNTKEYSPDGTGLQLAGIFFDDDMPTFRARMGYGNYTPPQSGFSGHSRIARSAQYTIDFEACLAEKSGEYGFAAFSPAVAKFIAFGYCDFLASLPPYVFAGVGVIFNNMLCTYKGIGNHACQGVVAITPVYPGIKAGAVIQNYCEAFQTDLMQKCKDAGFSATITMAQSGVKWNTEAAAVYQQSITCPAAPGGGPNKCVPVTCSSSTCGPA